MERLTRKSFVERIDRLEAVRGSEGRWRNRTRADTAVTTSQFARHPARHQHEQVTYLLMLSTALLSLPALVGEECGAVD